MQTKFHIYYMKPDFHRDGMMGAEWLRKRNRFPTIGAITETHTHLKTIELPAAEMEEQLERIFHDMQGEIWSPNGEARPLIREKGLEHTSMSVGDVVMIDGAGAWIVDSFGFEPFNDNP